MSARNLKSSGGGGSPPMMFEEVLIQTGNYSANNLNSSGWVGGASPPMMFEEVMSHSNWEELVMLMMREAKSKNQ